jgi:hypothetical protein
MEKNLSMELVEEIKKIREEMQKQTLAFKDIAKAIVEELRGIKNEVSR